MQCLLYLLIIFAVGYGTNISSDVNGSLLNLYQRFHFSDLDDDGYVEYDETMKHFRRADLNHDGFLSYQEVSTDMIMNILKLEEFEVFDLNGDELWDSSEVDKVYFDIWAGFGNDIEFKEYLDILSPSGNDTINSFVQSVNDFFVVDIDDDGLLTEEEFQAEVRVADFNQDGFLDKTELRGLFPIRHFQTEGICTTDPTKGCKFKELYALFLEADPDKKGFLQLENYVRYFLK